VTLDDWLRAHEFLRPIAALRAAIDEAVAAQAPPCCAMPDWDAYRAEFAAGVPLLHSVEAAIDLGPIDAAAARVADAAGRGHDEGLRRCVNWLVLSASLRPLLDAFAAWRDDAHWLRAYCPACGSPPAMAQLVGVEPGRQRCLVCGCCGSRWQYGRTACPFCEHDAQRLRSLGIEGEGGLRIDCCESCRGYLKTYDGHGHEAVLLADWTSLHLDLAARERGWLRLATSLYDLDDDAQPVRTEYRSGSEHPEGPPQTPA
jgi:FdhE protein